MADTCTYCGEDLGGVYQCYWGNPCHPECNPENIAAAKERERQRQIGRDEATRATPPASVVEAMERALRDLINDAVDLANSGDAGFWDAEKTSEVIAGRTALAALTAWRDAQ